MRLNEPGCSLAPGKASWKQEYKRVYYHSPVVHTETLREHTDEVLHVSFAHRGHLFSTTSKDATLRVSTGSSCLLGPDKMLLWTKTVLA